MSDPEAAAILDRILADMDKALADGLRVDGRPLITRTTLSPDGIVTIEQIDPEDFYAPEDEAP